MEKETSVLLKKRVVELYELLGFVDLNNCLQQIFGPSAFSENVMHVIFGTWLYHLYVSAQLYVCYWLSNEFWHDFCQNLSYVHV